MPTKKHIPKKVPLRKQKPREFEISKMNWQQYMETRAQYIAGRSNNGYIKDYFIFVFAVYCIFLSPVFIVKFLAVWLIILMAVQLEFCVKSYTWAIDTIDKKETFVHSKYGKIVETLNMVTNGIFLIICLLNLI